MKVGGGTVAAGAGTVGAGAGTVGVGAGSVGSGGGEVGVGSGCVAVGRMRVGVEGSAVGWMASGVGFGGAAEPQLLSTVASSVTVTSRITHLGIVSLPCLVNPSPVNGAPPHDELESQDRIGYRANRAVQNRGADAKSWSLPPMVSQATPGVNPCFRQPWLGSKATEC